METKIKNRMVKYKKNPFLEAFEVQLKQRKIRVGTCDNGLADVVTGEIVAHAAIYQREEYDPEQFIKVYHNYIHANYYLSKKAIKLMEYVFSETQKAPNQDIIYLSLAGAKVYFDKVKKKCAKTTYSGALNELLAKGFLAKTVEINRFYINPTMFFNGDRALLIQDIRKKRKSEKNILADKDPNTLDMFKEVENGQPN